jgi:hypothetical protein
VIGTRRRERRIRIRGKKKEIKWRRDGKMIVR